MGQAGLVSRKKPTDNADRIVDGVGLLHGGSDDQIWVSKTGLQKEKWGIFVFSHKVLAILKDPVFLVTLLGMVDVASQPEICGDGKEGSSGGTGMGKGQRLREGRKRRGGCTFHTQLLPGLTFSPAENKGPIHVARVASLSLELGSCAFQ